MNIPKPVNKRPKCNCHYRWRFCVDGHESTCPSAKTKATPGPADLMLKFIQNCAGDDLTRDGVRIEAKRLLKALQSAGGVE